VFARASATMPLASLLVFGRGSLADRSLVAALLRFGQTSHVIGAGRRAASVGLRQSAPPIATRHGGCRGVCASRPLVDVGAPPLVVTNRRSALPCRGPPDREAL
jgi:hypothetical protein